MSKNRQNHIKAVLFDLDGVLVETETLKAEAHAAAIRAFGGHVDPALYAEVIGLSHELTRSAFIAASHLIIEPAAYTRTYRQLYRDLVDHATRLTPGIMSLVQKLAGRGTLLAVVSSSPADLLEDICRRTGLLPFFPVRISADDVRAPKPAPDAYRLALERLGITARQAIAIEDTRAGLEAALQAGLPAIILRHEYNVRQDYPEAVGVFERPLDADRVVQVIDHFKYPGGDEISGDGLWKRQKSSSNM